MSTATQQFVLVLLACCAHVVICSFNGNYTDGLSLLEFKKAISADPQQALTSWNDSTNFCKWEGVLCSKTIPRRVTSLALGNRGLAGHISPSLGNLTFLKHLFLATNVFSGQIPASLGHLHRLETIILSNNTLQGTIPSFANCSHLTVLWLDRNSLVGHFPDVPLGLKQLQLSANHLFGTIPSSLANITTLEALGCGFNNIEGSIPSEFARLPILQKLYVGVNQLAGTFPLAILNLSTLDGLSLNTNRLSGTVPSSLGSSLPNLQLFSIAGNYFHGHIPSSLTNASSLYSVLLSNNSFTGVVPRGIGKLANLSVLNLEVNNLQSRNSQGWEFLNSLANCTKLQVLSIAGNQFEGPVPSSLGNLSNQLQSLYLGGNQLSGFFPSSLTNLRNLIILALESNQFTGMVPESLGYLKTLQGLSLSNNKFTGFIPSSISNLSQLVELLLDSNQFSGNIPHGMENLRSLEVVNISSNSVHGKVPKEIFRIPTISQIGLSFNNLDGQLPAEVGNAKQLVNLQLSYNKLSGEIPSTLGNCESLQDIELDSNILTGVIPTSLVNIIPLKVLNLSNNSLSGSIPPSLGSLQLLVLDLSFNNLGGEVPANGIFTNETGMRIDGNQELCGGLPELHLPKCYISPLDSAKRKQSLLLKVVISVSIMVLITVLISILLFFWRRKQKTKSVSLPSLGRELPKISYSDIVRATEGFLPSNLIGQGSYGSVYRGKLFQDGNVVAIKVFSLNTRGAQKSFIAECNVLRNVRHRNLVPILTACSSIDSNGNDFKAVVYKFMPGGDLYSLLYSSQDSVNFSGLNYISLAQRLNIVVDISDALAYLHHEHQGTVIHCDMKPCNILLDDDMVAHVGDFGLAKFKASTSTFADSNSPSSAIIKGTVGYVAPECAGGIEVSTVTDVYSFGVVLLEIFLRRKPTDDMFKDGMSISKFTEINFPDNVLQIIDPQLLQELDLSKELPVARGSTVQILQSVLSIGLCCTKASPKERITMQEVAAKLHGIREVYLRGN